MWTNRYPDGVLCQHQIDELIKELLKYHVPPLNYQNNNEENDKKAKAAAIEEIRIANIWRAHHREQARQFHEKFEKILGAYNL